MTVMAEENAETQLSFVSTSQRRCQPLDVLLTSLSIDWCGRWGTMMREVQVFSAFNGKAGGWC